MQNIIDTIFNFIYPPRCLTCGRFGGEVCEKCIKKYLKPKEGETCVVCNNASQSSLCPNCQDKLNLNDLIIFFEPNKLTDALIYQIKYNYNYSYADILAKLIINSTNYKLLENMGEEIVITSVPLHKERLKKRGFNQSELIGRKLASNIGCSYQDILKRDKNTSSQVGLSKKQRIENVQDAFGIKESSLINTSNVVIFDDIFTTGSTLRECAKTIKLNYKIKIIGCVISKGT